MLQHEIFFFLRKSLSVLNFDLLLILFTPHAASRMGA